MDQVNSQPPEESNAQSDSAIVPPGSRVHTDQKQNTNSCNTPSNKGCSPNQEKGGYWQQLLREKPDRHIELFLTLVIGFFAAVQLVVSCSNNASTSQQTQQLITAAGISAYAAQQNLAAARSFSDSAKGINQGVSDAVDRLNIQAEDLAINADEMKRLASATEAANRNAADADRPWIGAFLIPPQNFIVGQIPSASVIFVNSGRRPARVMVAAIQTNYFVNFPSNPPYVATGIRSQSFVVPGGSITNKSNLLKTALTQQIFTDHNSETYSFYLYGKAEYVDSKTNQSHFTHVCYQYVPASGGQDAGFYGTSFYNDAN